MGTVILESKFDLGDTVYHVGAKRTYRTVLAPGVSCKLCHGALTVSIAGHERRCPDINNTDHKQVCERIDAPDVKGPFTICDIQLRAIVSDLKHHYRRWSHERERYMCRETGSHSGRMYYGIDLFSTDYAAQHEADRRCKGNVWER